MLVEGFVATVYDHMDGLGGIAELRGGIAGWLAALEQDA